MNISQKAIIRIKLVDTKHERSILNAENNFSGAIDEISVSTGRCFRLSPALAKKSKVARIVLNHTLVDKIGKGNCRKEINGL